MNDRLSMINPVIEVSGVGLHSGEITTVKIKPDRNGKGRYFIRVDLPDKPIIRATVESVDRTTLSTELGVGDAKVRTVEHLLAALVSSNIDDVAIEIDGGEVPLLDGSAKIWIEEIIKAGFIFNKSDRENKIIIEEPIWIREDDSFVAAIPSSETRFSYGIDFPNKAIGNQWHSFNPSIEDFATEIAPARTFGLAEQIEQLRSLGLIKGGSLENALVCNGDSWINPPLRFTNEPVRHKLLDLVGDLSLLGNIPQAHFIAYKASHKLHIELAKKIYSKKL